VRPVSKKLIAVVAGALIAGTPVALFNYWLNDLILEQIRDEVDSTARRSITLAEGRISLAIGALDDLARRGVMTCGAEHLDALRHSNLDHSGIAEFSVLDQSGRTLCSDLGVALRHRLTLTTEEVADSAMVLDVMVVDERPQRMLRVRRPVGSGFVAALIPGDLLIAKVSTQGGLLLNAHGRLAASDGTLLATSGPLTDFGSLFEAPVTSRLASKRFGLNITMTRPRSMLSRSQEEMRFLGSVVNGVIALALFAVGILGPWRQRNNPVAEMERALRAGEFVPYYQPIVDITSGRMRGCEVLVRWRKPDGTLVPPASFIPLAESSGLIMDMTRSLMRTTVQELGAVCETRPYLKIGFNLAAQHFGNDSIVHDVRKIFENSPIKMNQVVLEVTERQPLDNLSQARRVIGDLQSLGVRVAIDDIGAGHSGLSYILKLGVDIIKIDKMFVDALGTESSSTAIIGTLVDLASNMDIEIIAEGVETFEQVIALRERGIQAVQGYVFAPPLPGPSFLRLLEATDQQSETQPEPDAASARALPSFGFGYLSSRRRASAA
jgi:sensor c-di-GMP phosphodiesterase-like protein